jgi:hypothetical protein
MIARESETPSVKLSTSLEPSATFGCPANWTAYGLFLVRCYSDPKLAAPESVEQRIGLRVLKFGPVWVFDKDGRVNHICVFAGYRGRLAGSIGVGSLVSDVEAAFGPVEDLEWDEYSVPGMPGWCFAVEQGSPALGEPGWTSVRLDSICSSEAT